MGILNKSFFKGIDIFLREKQFFIGFLKDKNLVYLESKGFIFEERLRNACLVILEVLQKTGARSIIINLSLLSVIGEQDRLWMKEVFYPQMKKLLLANIYIISPDSYFGKLSIKDLNIKEIYKPREGCTLLEFDSLDKLLLSDPKF
ncbi:hypothetical protein [Flexithrix dorotheae]|uniref:hypothetical protein n=1 Tax=Flexithrix dorotheae TaxID=70993 RepID=UPI00036C0768|nr:hypothetical protein [Flexithrix dorotheae]